MPRTPVTHADIVPLIVTALNGTTVNGGVLSAKADGQSVIVVTHNDASVPAHSLRLHVTVH